MGMISGQSGRAGAIGACALAMTLILTPLALAQEAVTLGTFNRWTAYKSTDAAGEICYISSAPQQMLPANVNHGSIHFLVIHRKGTGDRNEVQSMMDYALREGSEPTATVDGQIYRMIVEGQTAWLASADDDAGFVASMKRGRELVVQAVSARGTNTTYTYSLSGVTAAMGAIDTACT